MWGSLGGPEVPTALPGSPQKNWGVSLHNQ